MTLGRTGYLKMLEKPPLLIPLWPETPEIPLGGN